MKIELTDMEMTDVKLALEMYMTGLVIELGEIEFRNAAKESAIGTSLRLIARVTNLQLGCAETYDIPGRIERAQHRIVEAARRPRQMFRTSPNDAQLADRWRSLTLAERRKAIESDPYCKHRPNNLSLPDSPGVRIYLRDLR